MLSTCPSDAAPAMLLSLLRVPQRPGSAGHICCVVGWACWRTR
jgi:hypothetical protein